MLGLNMDLPQNARFGPTVSLAYEAVRQDLRARGGATLRVYEKLRQSLGEFVGATGFQSLASAL